MTVHHKHDYQPGQTVLAEGVVVDYRSGDPYGAVLVSFPAGTDESFLLDGITAWLPQALIYTEGEVFDLTHYSATEGTYDEEED